MSDAFDNKNSFLSKLLKFPYGEIATSLFYISIIGGIGISLSFDVEKPLQSISEILILDYFGSFLRNIHYWASHLFLIFSILHIIEHLIIKSEQKVKNVIWFHLTFSIFLIFYVMLSGFLLKGDYDSLHAFKIFSTIARSIPFVGDEISFFLLGNEYNFKIIFFQHVGTSTIILLFIILEHSRIFLPRYDRFLIAALSVLILSFLLTPLPNDSFSMIIKGPWYLAGLQEFLHWFSNPVIVIVILILILFLFYLIKIVSNIYRKILLITLSIIILSLTILTVTGLFFRGENWQLISPSYKNINVKFEFLKFLNPSTKEVVNVSLKVIEGRFEGCLSCHNMKGLTSSHNPEQIGCFSCHRGNVYTLNKNSAHRGMILIPGNLSNAKLTCGNSKCHPDLLYRVERSIMSTLSGMISVDKFTFDEIKTPEGRFNVKDLKYSAADTHLRNLCVSCHLGNEKNEFGKIDELSRGGGCLACHLNYNNETEEQLNHYKQSKEQLPVLHPTIDLKISNDHCFGCHSRSGRISTNYEGWSEILPEEVNFKEKEHRSLKDGRISIKQIPDIHFEKGMDCVDCHISLELMGDGNVYEHKEQQIKISCEDCHTEKLNLISLNEIDYETKKILTLRDTAYFNQDNKLIALKGTKIPFTNKIEISNGKTFFFTKNSNKKLELKKPAPECTANSHKNLSCESCHTNWVTRCNGCHTKFDPNEIGFDHLTNQEIKGSWIEEAHNFEVGQPTLGIIKIKDKEKISSFIPGMIIKISDQKSKTIKFNRLFAQTFPHTIRKEVRSCKSCHQSSTALGYGKGKIGFSEVLNKFKIDFTPEDQINPIDLLPNDAWIKFLDEGTNSNSTRTYAKNLPLEKQKKVLLVGACLNCHKENSKVINESLINFENTLKNRSPKCILPKF
ncbi:MAG: cytochrome b N-terminal domain-containing protein [Ignavibacteria bacterium]